MPSITGPVIGGALGAVGSIGGALIGGQSAQDAANAQIQAAQLAIAEQQREYDQTRTDHLPWLTTGSSALDQLAKIYGLDTYQNGQVQKGTGTNDFSSFWKAPDYNIAMQQGIAGVDAGAAARGSLDSGATRKAEATYASNLGTSQFNNYANRLAGIAGVGQTAADFVGTAGQNTANQIGNYYTNQGNAMASSYLSQGNLYGNALGNLAGIGAGMFSNSGGYGSSGGYQSGGDPYSDLSNWLGW
jgi:hypothetical protein